MINAKKQHKNKNTQETADIDAQWSASIELITTNNHGHLASNSLPSEI